VIIGVVSGASLVATDKPTGLVWKVIEVLCETGVLNRFGGDPRELDITCIVGSVVYGVPFVSNLSSLS